MSEDLPPHSARMSTFRLLDVTGEGRDGGDAASAARGNGAVRNGQHRNGDAAKAAIPADTSNVTPLKPANDPFSDILANIQTDPDLPFYMASAKGRLVHVNDAYRWLEDQCREKCLSPGPSDGVGREVTAALAAVMGEVMRNESVMLTEEALREGERTRHWRGRHFPVRGRDGEVIGVAGTYFDITREVSARRENKAVRQRFEDFARASSDWFWEMDRHGVLINLSERFTAMTGQPAGLYVGKKLEDIGSMPRRHGQHSSFHDAIDRASAFRDQLFEVRIDGMGLRRFHLSGVPVFDNITGEFAGYRGSGKDVTQRYREEEEARSIRANLEETLEELTRKNMQLDVASAAAESALRAKNEFLAAMSHELRTPLNAIIGFAETMNMEVFGNLDDRYLGYSGDILKAGRHLLGLINDVLDVAVIEGGQLTLSPEPIDVGGIVEEAAQLVRQRAREKNVKLISGDFGDDMMVMVDARRATQIFVNLYTNAVKFTPEGGRIGVDLRTSGAYLDITIWDTGIGIAKDMQELVFEKFHQVTDTIYSRKQEGTGLGLHISRELARRMGGDILLDSTPGEGSRFTVRLRLAS